MTIKSRGVRLRGPGKGKLPAQYNHHTPPGEKKDDYLNYTHVEKSVDVWSRHLIHPGVPNRCKGNKKRKQRIRAGVKSLMKR